MATNPNENILEKALKERVDALYLEYIFPVLATVRLGEDPAAAAYEAELLAAAKAAGIRVRRYIMPAELSQAEVAGLIREIDGDRLLSALLVLEPLPAHLDRAALPASPKALEAAPCAVLLDRVVDFAEKSAR